MVGADRTSNVDMRGAKIAGKSTPRQVNASAWKSQRRYWPNLALQCSVANDCEQL
jgi:hypothetical protein